MFFIVACYFIFLPKQSPIIFRRWSNLGNEAEYKLTSWVNIFYIRINVASQASKSAILGGYMKA